MRFTWTVAGDDPDWPTLERHAINGAFAPLWDSLTTPTYLRELQSRVGVVGVYLGHNWFPGESAAAQARRVSAEWKRLQGKTPIKDLRVMLNWEQHDPDDIVEGLQEWRRLHRTVNTSWSMEGMQGGWMGPIVSDTVPASEFVQRVLACRVRLVPQGFWGSQGRIDGAWAEDQVLRDLTRRGFPENIVSLFYDGKALPRDWDGYAFTAGRLPMFP